MSLSIYGKPNCEGPTIWAAYASRRVSSQCNGADQCPLRWSSFTYLGNFRLQINFNCSADCTSNCQYASVVDTRSCWSLGPLSGTVDSIDAGRGVNADQFAGTCSRENVIERNSVEEGVCFAEFVGLLSSTFQCEGAPPPPSMKGKKL